MTLIRKKMVVANWKMNGKMESLKEIESLKVILKNPKCEILLCPPSTLLLEAQRIIKNSEILIGAQNCHSSKSGPHTGEVSAEMLADIGVRSVILGHSERRTDNHETNELIKEKAKTAQMEGLSTIICVGESEAQKLSGETETVVKEQLEHSLPDSANDRNTIIAYEPIWAIGTGLIPSISEILTVHGALRSHLTKIKGRKLAEKIRILYGGSVKPENCRKIMELNNVDGALVGGSSLLAKTFHSIIASIK
jgi:triosephosphate isomerase